MRKYHREEFEIHRARMILFGLFEGFNIALQVHYSYEKIFDKYTALETMVLVLSVSGVPVIFQLIGLYYIKSIKDPI